MPLSEGSLATALKELPSFSGDGSLAFSNPYYSPIAPATSTQSISQVEHTIKGVLDCAGLSLQRAGLFFMDEPATPTAPDILLAVVYVALGRIWRREKTLLDVHNSFRARIETTQYRSLPNHEAETLLDAESAGRKGKYTDAECADIASTLHCVMECFDWDGADMIKFVKNVKSKSKGAGFKYQQLRQFLGRTVSLHIGRSTVIADLPDENPATTSTTASRQTLVGTTFERVREWIVAEKVRFHYEESSGDWAVIPFTAAEAYGSNALPVGGQRVQPDTRARYEKVLARALEDVAPTCGTLQDQVQVLTGKDKTVKNKEMEVAIERRALQYGLPGAVKCLVAESKKLSKI